MKILLITTLYPGYKKQKNNEVTYAVHYFAQEWKRQGHEVKVVRPWVVYPRLLKLMKKTKRAVKYGYNESFYIDNVNIKRCVIGKIPKIDYSKGSIINTYNHIRQIIKTEFRPNIILCHMINPSIYIGSLLKKEFNIPLVLTVHTGDITLLQNKVKKKKFEKIQHQIDRVNFRSEKLKKEYNKIFTKYNYQEEQFVAYSGINKEFVIDSKYMENKIHKKPSRIFIAANLIPLKNIDIIIKAFSTINNSDLLLEIAGYGPEKDNLINLVRKSPVKNNIIFLGMLEREKVLSKMRDTDIFVMVSSPETFGLVYLEAMASGCITIGSKGEGIDGVINNNINGYLCTPRDVDELITVFNKILGMSIDDKEIILTNALDTAKKMIHEEMSMKYINILEDTTNNIKNDQKDMM